MDVNSYNSRTVPCSGCGYLIENGEADIVEVCIGDAEILDAMLVTNLPGDYTGNRQLWRGHRMCFEQAWGGQELPPSPVKVEDKNQTHLTDHHSGGDDDER